MSLCIAEHKHHLWLGQTEKWAVAQHYWTFGHQARFEDMLVLFHSDNWLPCVIRESLEIALLDKSLNQEEGLKLSTAWLPLYEQLVKERIVS